MTEPKPKGQQGVTVESPDCPNGGKHDWGLLNADFCCMKCKASFDEVYEIRLTPRSGG